MLVIVDNNGSEQRRTFSHHYKVDSTRLAPRPITQTSPCRDVNETLTLQLELQAGSADIYHIGLHAIIQPRPCTRRLLPASINPAVLYAKQCIRFDT